MKLPSSKSQFVSRTAFPFENDTLMRSLSFFLALHEETIVYRIFIGFFTLKHIFLGVTIATFPFSCRIITLVE